MNATLLTIGDEILIGQIVNTNAAFMAKQLNAIGVTVQQMLTIGDGREEILSALKTCGEQSQIVLITGGLGPTSDDITKPAMCEFFETTLRPDAKVYAMVESLITKLGGDMNPLNVAQANVPVAATVIYNPIGTSPGLWFEKNGTVYVAMPGVPFEMEALMVNEIIPRLKVKFHLGEIFHKTVLTTGIGESKLAITIEEWEKQLPSSVKLAYLPSPGMVKLRLSIYDKSNADNIIENEIVKLKAIIGNAIWGYDNDTMESVVGKLLLEKGKSLSTAESCTGGNVSRLITSVAGSSAYFKGGLVAYSNDLKIDYLQVPASTIEKQGAVSSEVVEAMVKGALQAFKSDYAIAISGIAGPTGGTLEKPVGTVWIAVGSKDKIVAEKFSMGENRDRTVTRASAAALNMLRKMLLA